MPEFPAFVRSPANRIAPASQHTEDVEGYVFDGADGSQAALWTCHRDRTSTEHRHPFDEYVFVLAGTCTAVLDGVRVDLTAGQELTILAGTLQTMSVTAGKRTLHVVGGRRAERATSL